MLVVTLRFEPTLQFAWGTWQRAPAFHLPRFSIPLLQSSPRFAGFSIKTSFFVIEFMRSYEGFRDKNFEIGTGCS